MIWVHLNPGKTMCQHKNRLNIDHGKAGSENFNTADTFASSNQYQILMNSSSLGQSPDIYNLGSFIVCASFDPFK